MIQTLLGPEHDDEAHARLPTDYERLILERARRERRATVALGFAIGVGAALLSMAAGWLW